MYAHSKQVGNLKGAGVTLKIFMPDITLQLSWKAMKFSYLQQWDVTIRSLNLKPVFLLYFTA